MGLYHKAQVIFSHKGHLALVRVHMQSFFPYTMKHMRTAMVTVMPLTHFSRSQTAYFIFIIIILTQSQI